MEDRRTSPKEDYARWLTLIVVAAGSFISTLDITIINVAIPSIIDHFQDALDKSEWLISGYTLTTSIVLLCSGWFARRYGYKRVYVIGAIVFTVSSYLCSIAPTMDYFVAMRMVQGVGSGIIIPLSMSILARNFTGRDRGLAIGVLIMAVGVAVSVGPVLGGYFVEIGRWDWVFTMNVPMGALIVVMAIFMMENFRDKVVAKFDYIGLLLLLIWAPLSLYIMSASFEWWAVVLFVIAFGLFVLRMIRARNALINVLIFRNRNFVLAFIAMLCLGVVLQGGSYILSEYLLYSKHYTAFKVGMMFIPVGIIQGFMAPMVGSLTPKYGNKIFIMSGLVITFIYLYLSSKLTLDSSHLQILITLYVRGLGLGLSLTAITNLSLAGAMPLTIDSVSGVINMIKLLAGSLSIAIVTIMLAKRYNPQGVISPEGYVLASGDSFVVLAGVILFAIVALVLVKEDKPEGR